MLPESRVHCQCSCRVEAFILIVVLTAHAMNLPVFGEDCLHAGLARASHFHTHEVSMQPTLYKFCNVLEELTYLEFFAGKGLVWQAVRAAYPSSVKVDIEYMHPGSAMDILSDSGLASCPQHLSFPAAWFQCLCS